MVRHACTSLKLQEILVTVPGKPNKRSNQHHEKGNHSNFTLNGLYFLLVHLLRQTAHNSDTGRVTGSEEPYCLLNVNASPLSTLRTLDPLTQNRTLRWPALHSIKETCQPLHGKSCAGVQYSLLSLAPFTGGGCSLTDPESGSQRAHKPKTWQWSTVILCSIFRDKNASLE